MDFHFTDEQRMFRETVYRFAREEIAPLCEEADLKSEFSFDIWKKNGGDGTAGPARPRTVRCQGADFVTCCLARLKRRSCRVAAATPWPGSRTLPLRRQHHATWHGSAEKEISPENWLPVEWIGWHGTDRTGCGSDAAAMTTTAIRKGDKYILNGCKVFITNAPLSQVFVVFATLDKTQRHKGITTFIR